MPASNRRPLTSRLELRRRDAPSELDGVNHGCSDVESQKERESPPWSGDSKIFRAWFLIAVPVVVLILVNLLGELILLLIDDGTVGLAELAAVLLAHALHLTV